jgi:hypothetical protein
MTAPGLSEVAKDEGDDTANSLVGLWPRDRGLRGENGGIKAPGGSGLLR